MTASLYTKNLLRPMDELIRSIGESDIHEATRKLQYFDGKYYGVTHAMGATYFCERRDLREKKGLKTPETYDDMLKLAAALTEDGRYAFQMPGEKLYMGFVHPAEWMAGNGGSWVDAKTWRPQLNSKSMLETLDYLQKLNKFQSQGWSGQKYLDTQAALATGKIAMSYLSGARAIGYIEKYAPEGMRDPEHFMPMLRPHGPSGKVGISALDGENWAVFSQSKYPNEAFEFLRLFYKKEHYLQYCHSVPIHLTPDLQVDAERPGLPGQRAHQEVEGVARRDADRSPRQPLPAPGLHPARGQSPALPGRARRLEHRGGHDRGGHGGRQEPEGGGRSGAEARRGAPHPARSQALVVGPDRGRGE